MSHYFLHNLGPRPEIGQFLNEHVGLADINWDEDYEDKILGKGWMGVKASITMIKRNNSLKDLLFDIVSIGGDVDTAAAVGVGAASNSDKFKKDLPEVLYWTLEDGLYGRRYLEKLEANLRERY